MRKHFLILMLLTLLPLAGWAQGTDLSQGWAITFDPTVATYTGRNVTPAVKLTKDGSQAIETGFTAVWKKGDEVVTSLVDANPIEGYTVTVTANGTDTYAELAQPTKKFYVLKATPTFATENETTLKGALKTGGQYSTSGYTLIDTEPTVTFGQSTILYKVTDSNTAPASDAEGWVTFANLEKAVNPGDYYVWFKIPATDNYVEFISAVGGVDGQGKATSKLTITGINITTDDFTAPTAITTTNFTFDNAEHAVFTAAGSWGTKPVLGTFKYTIDNGNTWSDTIPTVKNGGTYTVNYMIEGKNGHNDYTSATAFTVTVNASSAAVITFAQSQGKTGLTYNAADQSLLSSAATADLGATPTYNVQYSATNLDNWSSVTSVACATSDLVKGKNAGFYRIEALVANGANYTGITSKFITVEIKKAKLYVTTKAETKVYGAPDPAFTIAEYRGFQGNDWYETVTATGKTMAAGFTAPTASREIPASGKAHQNVGSYKISASGGGANNYEFDFTEATGKSVFNNLTITKKALNKTDFSFALDLGENDPLTYDGTAQTPEIATATYNKYNGSNDVAVANLATATANMDSPADYAYTYQNNVNAGTNTAQCIITGQNNFEGSVVLTFSIAKADIYVLPLAAEKNYGANDPAAAATKYTGTADPKKYQYKLVNASNAEVERAVLNGVVELQREAGEAVSTYKIYFKSYTPDANVADNYDVKNSAELETENTALRTAIFTLKQASNGLKLKFKSTATATKVYGDGTPKWTIDDLEPVDVDPGFVGDDTWEVVKPTLSAPVFTLADENVSATDNKVTVTGLASTNYPTVTVEPLAFTVTPRPIAITVQPQTKDYGADPDQDAAGTENKWSVNDTKSYKNVTSAQGEPIASANQVGDALVGEDAASVLGIELYLENDAYSYAAGQTHTGVIKARIKAENSNYELNDNCVWGDLTINAVDAFVLNFNDQNLATKIATQAAAGTEKPIMFGSMTLNAKEWYAVVLPFNTTPAELVQKLGEYVVVNKLSSSKLGSEGQAVINFSMEWDEIKAGEPFVIKASKEINLQGKTFDARKIFAEFQEKSTDKATFKGNYETGKMVWLNHNLDGTEAADKHYRWLSHTGAAKYKVDADGNIVANGTYTGDGANNWKTAESAPHYLAPMEAYLELTSDVAYARIFVEDFENGVTAIKSLSADEVNGLKIAEGWYTIDGIRLQSAPTQKGIYINNGKKVVVK